jgi:phosphate-selective porin OprO/OprP
MRSEQSPARVQQLALAMITKSKTSSLVLAIVWIALPCAAAAQSAASAQSSDAEKTQEEKRTPRDPRFQWDDHPSLVFGDGTRIDFRFRLQGDLQRSQVALPDAGDTSLDIARRRIGVGGEVLGLVDFQVERELAVERDPWRDVFANYRQFSFAEVQAGKFKLPFGMDENTSSTNLDFLARSRIADLLSPGRDRGVMVHGRLLDRGILQYEVGVFDRDGRNARRSEDRVHGNRTIAGRAVVQPFRSMKSPMRDLAVGVAFTESDVPEGFPDLRGRTVFDLPFYRPDVWVNGQRQRVGVQARWRPGPFSIKSEYIRLTDERRGQSTEDTDLSPFLGTGWYVSGTWAVTRENKAAGLDRPRKPFLQGGYGAVELAARVERIRFGSVATDGVPSTGPRADVILGNGERVETVGVNWYANRWVKLQFNVIRETLADPAQGPSPSRPGFWSRVVRFQFML